MSTKNEQFDFVLQKFRYLNKILPYYSPYFGFQFYVHEGITYDLAMFTPGLNLYYDTALKLAEVMKFSETKVPFQKVVIFTDPDNFTDKPQNNWAEWYNYKSDNIFYNIYPDSRRENILQPLNTKPYITILDPFIRVKISRKDKGSDLILDDILFASRILMNLNDAYH